MPTLEDRADDFLRRCIRCHTAKCWQCDGKGLLEQRTFLGLESGALGIINPERKTPEACDECDGSGEIVPTPYAGHVMAGMLPFIVSGLTSTREAADFGSMNALIDWANRYVTQCMQGQLGAMEESDEPFDMDAFLEKFMDDTEPIKSSADKVTLSGSGALTEDELATLGIKP